MGRGIIGLGGRLIVDGEDGDDGDDGDDGERLLTLDRDEIEECKYCKVETYEMRLKTLDGLHGFSCGEDV